MMPFLLLLRLCEMSVFLIIIFLSSIGVIDACLHLLIVYCVKYRMELPHFTYFSVMPQTFIHGTNCCRPFYCERATRMLQFALSIFQYRIFLRYLIKCCCFFSSHKDCFMIMMEIFFSFFFSNIHYHKIQSTDISLFHFWPRHSTCKRNSTILPLTTQYVGKNISSFKCIPCGFIAIILKSREITVTNQLEYLHRREYL